MMIREEIETTARRNLFPILEVAASVHLEIDSRQRVREREIYTQCCPGRPLRI